MNEIKIKVFSSIYQVLDFCNLDTWSNYCYKEDFNNHIIKLFNSKEPDDKVFKEEYLENFDNNEDKDTFIVWKARYFYFNNVLDKSNIYEELIKEAYIKYNGIESSFNLGLTYLKKDYNKHYYFYFYHVIDCYMKSNDDKYLILLNSITNDNDFENTLNLYENNLGEYKELVNTRYLINKEMIKQNMLNKSIISNNICNSCLLNEDSKYLFSNIFNENVKNWCVSCATTYLTNYDRLSHNNDLTADYYKKIVDDKYKSIFDKEEINNDSVYKNVCIYMLRNYNKYKNLMLQHCENNIFSNCYDFIEAILSKLSKFYNKLYNVDKREENILKIYKLMEEINDPYKHLIYYLCGSISKNLFINLLKDTQFRNYNIVKNAILYFTNKKDFDTLKIVFEQLVYIEKNGNFYEKKHVKNMLGYYFRTVMNYKTTKDFQDDNYFNLSFINFYKKFEIPEFILTTYLNNFSNYNFEYNNHFNVILVKESVLLEIEFTGINFYTKYKSLDKEISQIFCEKIYNFILSSLDSVTINDIDNIVNFSNYVFVKYDITLMFNNIKLLQLAEKSKPQQVNEELFDKLVNNLFFNFGVYSITSMANKIKFDNKYDFAVKIYFLSGIYCCGNVENKKTKKIILKYLLECVLLEIKKNKSSIEKIIELIIIKSATRYFGICHLSDDLYEYNRQNDSIILFSLYGSDNEKYNKIMNDLKKKSESLENNYDKTVDNIAKKLIEILLYITKNIKHLSHYFMFLHLIDNKIKKEIESNDDYDKIIIEDYIKIKSEIVKKTLNKKVDSNIYHAIVNKAFTYLQRENKIKYAFDNKKIHKNVTLCNICSENLKIFVDLECNNEVCIYCYYKLNDCPYRCGESNLKLNLEDIEISDLR